MLAQMQAPPEMMGYWLMCLTAGMFLVYLVIQSLNAYKGWTAQAKQEDQYVTHAQFDAFKNENQRQHDELRAVISRELSRMAISQQTMTADVAWIKGVMQGRREAQEKADE